MKALMLAAGASTRLYPLTASLPKCLLPMGDATILDHQIDALSEADVTELVIVVGYRQHLIADHVARRKESTMRITLLPTETYATTGPILGGLVPLTGLFLDTVLFLHCDVLVTKDAVDSLIKDAHETALLYRPGTWDEEAGKIVVDDTGRVTELGKHIPKERASGEYLQIAKFGPDFCIRLQDVIRRHATEHRDGFSIDAFNEVLKDGGEAFGLPFTGLAMEIDTPEDYAAAKAGWEKRHSHA